jgi:photosystem II stability/assembly factor-like uncharacterized protein
MTDDRQLERALREALETRLGTAAGRYPEWGTSEQARRAMVWPGRSLRSLVPARLALAAAALLAIGLVGAAALRAPNQTAGSPTPAASCAGCGGSAILAAAAFDDRHIVGVGGTDGFSGDLVLVRSEDGGTTWGVEHPDAPAFTALARAGDRLYGSTECLPTYPRDYGLPSDQWGYPPATDRTVHPAPVSCLYYSDDRGETWYETGAGRLVDPTFADDTYGWAHTEYDPMGQTPSVLYATSDGGRTWTAQLLPCDAAAPWIEQAVATGQGAGYVLCVGARPDSPDPTVVRHWSLVRVAAGKADVVIGSDRAGVAVGTDVANFAMRSGGTGWVYADRYTPPTSPTEPYDWHSLVYRTSDGGSSWAPPQETPDWPGPVSVSYPTPVVGFAAFRDTGRASGILETTDGGLTWRKLASWDWWSFTLTATDSGAPWPTISLAAWARVEAPAAPGSSGGLSLRTRMPRIPNLAAPWMSARRLSPTITTSAGSGFPRPERAIRKASGFGFSQSVSAELKTRSKALPRPSPPTIARSSGQWFERIALRHPAERTVSSAASVSG